MNNIVIILLLVAGLVSGYFIGDYRGANARRALETAVETSKELTATLQQSNAQLSAELNTINENYQKELDGLRQKHAADNTEWARLKESLNVTIKQQQSRLQQLNNYLDQLLAKQNSVSGVERQRLEQEIARLRVEIGTLSRESEGATCLSRQVPQTVIELLNGVKVAGGVQ